MLTLYKNVRFEMRKKWKCVDKLVIGTCIFQSVFNYGLHSNWFILNFNHWGLIILMTFDNSCLSSVKEKMKTVRSQNTKIAMSNLFLCLKWNEKCVPNSISMTLLMNKVLTFSYQWTFTTTLLCQTLAKWIYFKCNLFQNRKFSQITESIIPFNSYLWLGLEFDCN